jgi:hypothetical protein
MLPFYPAINNRDFWQIAVQRRSPLARNQQPRGASVSARRDHLKWSTFAPPRWFTFAPPLTFSPKGLYMVGASYDFAIQDPVQGQGTMFLMSDLSNPIALGYLSTAAQESEGTGVAYDVIEASEVALKQLMERRYDELDLLILYIDGMQFQDGCVLAAVGVDVEGRKHVLALREGSTENAEAAKDLLRHPVEHGVDPARRRPFVIDGSKALRTAINAVFGAEAPVQRCRNHKLRNVLARLPRQQQAQAASLVRAAWKMNCKEGMARFRQIAAWLEHDWPDAAAALLEGLEECFTINRLDVPPSLHRCLATSNIVDNPHSGVRERTRRVCRWQPGMAARWPAAAFLEIEKSFRKIMGYRDLWALKAILDELQPASGQAVA